MRIAIFDLDGTITRHDTMAPYTFGFCLARAPLRLAGFLAMPWHLLRYAFDGHDRGRLKQALMRATLQGVSREEITRWNERWVPRLLKRGVHAAALKQLQKHRDAGDYLILMSASVDLYVPAIARALGMNETICTGVTWDGMKLDGHLSTPNRRDQEKVQCLQAVRERYPEHAIIGYGNSASDLPHLRLCDHGYLVNGSRKTAGIAAGAGVQVGWPG